MWLTLSICSPPTSFFLSQILFLFSDDLMTSYSSIYLSLPCFSDDGHFPYLSSCSFWDDHSGKLTVNLSNTTTKARKVTLSIMIKNTQRTILINAFVISYLFLSTHKYEFWKNQIPYSSRSPITLYLSNINGCEF